MRRTSKNPKKDPQQLHRLNDGDVEFLDKLIDGYYGIDFNWKYIYVNQKGADLAYKKREEMIGKSVRELFPDTFLLPFGKASRRVMRTRNPERVEAYHPSMGKWYENNIYPTEYGISVFARDVTEAKTLNNNLKFLAEASKMLSTSLDYRTTLRAVAKIAVPHIADWCTVSMLDINGQLQIVAAAHKDPKKVRWARELNKQTPVDMDAKTGAPHVIRTGKSAFYPVITYELIRQSTPDKKILAKVLAIIHTLGGLNSLIIVPIFLQNRPIGVLQFVNAETKKWFNENDLKMAEEVASRASLAIENATLYKSAQEELAFRKRLESELFQTQRKYSALVDANIVGVIIANINGRIYQANDAFLRMVGYTRRDLQRGRLNWKDLSPPSYGDVGDAAVSALLKKGKADPYENEFIRKDGSKVPIIIGVVMLNPETAECMALVLDITARKELEERKDEFISIASHELKTPLTSIKGYVQILERLQEVQDVERKKRYLKKTNLYIDRLNSLIADLLDVSKIQAGRLQFNISEFNFEELVRDGIDSIQYADLKHKIVQNGEVKIKIRGDRHRLEQVFTNLLNNAIKYSPESDRIIVHVHYEDGSVRVGIQDFGVGIPAVKQKNIFERFYRVEETAHEFSGLGIGLYISSQIVARHGGNMWVESKVGRGSTFYFTLPAKKSRK